jgi:hypothetical protein
MMLETETGMPLATGRENFQEADLDLLRKTEGRTLADAGHCQ